MAELTELQKQCIAFKENPMVNNIVWKDCTSYSRGDKDRIPTAFEATVGEMRISIVCSHVWYKGEWIFNCHELGFKEKHLGVMSPETAADMAYLFCKNKVGMMAVDFNLIKPKTDNKDER